MSTYEAGMRRNRVGIWTKKEATDTEFGRTGGGYEFLRNVWAAVDWSKGVKSLREGALDAYDTIMVRMLYASDITKECQIEFGGKRYQIDSFHDDKYNNTIQITATELQ